MFSICKLVGNWDYMREFSILDYCMGESKHTSYVWNFSIYIYNNLKFINLLLEAFVGFTFCWILFQLEKYGKLMKTIRYFWELSVLFLFIHTHHCFWKTSFSSLGTLKWLETETRCKPCFISQNLLPNSFAH